MAEAETSRIEAEFREAALDAAVASATVEVPDALVEARARELWDQMLHSLSHQGIYREAYLRISGRDEEEIVEQAKPDAEQALRREAVLAAVVEAERSSRPRRRCSRRCAEARRRARRRRPKKLLERLRSNGRLDSLKDDLAQRKALDLLAESAKPVPAAEQPDS